ncbi:DUF6602 domain-containing protein [Gracilibacillus timonensis]|uniref:DUF6602 domain-containing protein n=1 Tax=Gracilibacillus timonensis TaxID=1816696 RepID=UPI000825E648|nr:DUF6602 domain-containing protein [Gracilibacillus timonensis]
MTTGKTEIVKQLIHNYMSEEVSMVNQLYFEHPHGTTVGTFREEIWSDWFQDMIPKKFVVEHSVFLIDSSGRISNEVDLAILDEMYTPYILKKGKIKFIPIEAVAVAVECKSKVLKCEQLNDWCESVKNLKTSRRGIARMQPRIVGYSDQSSQSTTQTATRPLLILCYLGETEKNTDKLDFDFIVHAKKTQQEQRIQITGKKEGELLSSYYDELNHSREGMEENKSTKVEWGLEDNYSIDDYRVWDKTIGKTEVSLLSFNFMLNQILMLINNPMLFPHKAYVDMFNRGETEDGGREI